MLGKLVSYVMQVVDDQPEAERQNNSDPFQCRHCVISCPLASISWGGFFRERLTHQRLPVALEFQASVVC